MTSNSVSATNIRAKKKIKPENYTPQIYQYIRESFTGNLAFIIDN